MKVIVTGASGLLGQDIADVFKEKHDVIELKGRKFINITDTKEVVSFIKQQKPDLIIHSAGWRNVDEVEKNKEKALLINTLGTKNIALGAKASNSLMVHIGTDSIFDGKKKEPYTEFDQPCPVNTYGYSKLKAEEMVTSLLDRFFIVRVPLLFGAKGKKEDNLIYSTWEKLKNGEKIYAPTDQVCSPTYTKDIGDVLLNMVQTEYYGTYHLSNEGLGSRYDLIKTIAELKGLDTDNVIACTSDRKFAKRPKNTAFNGIAFRNTFGVVLSDWKNALKRCIETML